MRDDATEPAVSQGSRMEERCVFLEALLNAAGQAIIATDVSGRVTYWNPRAVELYGWSRDEALGRPVIELAVPEVTRAQSAEILQALACGEAWSGEFLCKRRDGTSFLAYVTDTPILDDEGELVGIIGVSTDASRCKLGEEALARSEAFLNTTGRMAKVGGWEMDADTQELRYTEETHRIHGLPVGEIPPLDEAIDFYEPEERPRLRQAIERALADGQPYDLELRFVTAQGKRLWVHALCEPQVVDGKTVKLLGTFQDITERKRAEKELRESEALLSAIVENIPDMVFVKSAESLRFVRLNKAAEQLLGSPREDLLGKCDHDFFPKEEADFFTQSDRAVLGGGGALDIPVEPIETRLKGRRLLHTKKVPLYEAGQPRYLLGISEDITERVQMEEALRRGELERRALEAQMRQAQKLESLGVLAGGIAHEFNNLLTVIAGNLELSLSSLPAGSRLLARVQSALGASRRAAELTGQMLAYSGKRQLAVRALDLDAMVLELDELLDRSRSKSAKLELQLAGDLPTIEADAGQIQQVVMNLVTNAAEAIGDEAGTIRVATRAADFDRALLDSFQGGQDLPEGRYVSFEVSDTGCGMEEGTRGRIFEPFFSTKFTGRGLGLAAVLGIVRSHRGAIRVESEPGKGTTVVVLFPVSEGRGGRASVEGGLEEAWRGSGTVLVVDDKAPVRLLAVDILETLGFSALEAASGSEGLDLFRQRHEEIVCVLLDLKMPGMDGRETFHEIRRIHDDVPIILASGYAESEATSGLYEIGLAGFLPKPYGPAALRSKLREVLRE